MSVNTKKIQYFLVAVSFSFMSTLVLASELTQEEVNERNFQLHGIALFGGTDVFSRAIKVVTKSPYSHIGVLLHDADKEVADYTSWYCFESTGAAGEVLKGNWPHVRVTPWSTIVQNYGGGVTIRHMQCAEGHEPDVGEVTDFVREYNGVKYEKDLDELFLSLGNNNTESDLDNVFCSELTAEMFMNLGYMKRGEEGDGLANNWLPSEFAQANDSALTLRGAYFLPEEPIKIHQPGYFESFTSWFMGLGCMGRQTGAV